MNKSNLTQKPEGWDPVAQTYDAVAAPLMAQFVPDALQLTDSQPGDRVLDVAAGTGALSLAAAGRGAEVLATDFSPGMIDYLRGKLHEEGIRNVDTAVMDGQALEVADNSFDAAFSLFGLMLFPDRAAGFRELYRAIKPGGRVAVVTWSAMDRLQFIQVIMGALKEAVPDFPPPKEPPLMFSLANREMLKAEMQEGGFADVRVSTVTRSTTFSNLEDFIEGLPGVSPTFSLMFGTLQPGQRKAFRAAFMRHVRRQGEGPFEAKGEAHIAVGLK